VALVALAAGIVSLPASTAAWGDTPAVTLACTTYVSNAHPHQRTSVLVYVHTHAKAGVLVTAHFKSGNVAHSAAADTYGNATFRFKVGSAPKGYVVHVVVRVTWKSLHAACQTKFTPK
jgi:hypothetical protein